MKISHPKTPSCDLITNLDDRKLEEIAQFRKNFGGKYVSLYVHRFDTPPSNHPIEKEVQPQHCNFTVDNSKDAQTACETMAKILESYFE